MSQRPYWVSIVQWTLWALLMAGIMGWLGRARMKRTISAGQVVMTYPLGVLVVAVICVAISVALVALSLFASPGNAPWWTTAIFALMLAASLHWLVDCWVARYALSEEGLEYASVFFGKRFFRWDEMRSLKYAPNMRWFRFENTQGQVARISVMMTGLPDFARLLLEHARNVNIDAAAFPILEQTARGDPPSLWL